MPKSHPPYPAEFRARMVELVRSGRSLEELARPAPQGFLGHLIGGRIPRGGADGKEEGRSRCGLSGGSP